MEIITANELLSGASVYLDGDGRWQINFGSARLFGADDSAVRDQIVAQARADGRLVGVEVEKVTLKNNGIVALRLRERIRAEGPTAPYGSARQDLGGDGDVSL